MKAGAHNKTGFTIVELLIVIIVIGILAALVLVAYSNVTNQAKTSNLQADLNRAGKQLNVDRENSGGSSYPASLAAANGGNGIAASSGNTFTYTVGPGPTPYYCLQAVNGSYTYHVTPTLSVASGGCQGLTGTYFNNMTLSAPSFVTQTDSTVNFNWGSGSPMTGMPTDLFSVRWSGYVTTTTAGTYTFAETTDDGIRLYINGSLLIDYWSNSTGTHTTSLTLGANQQVPITMEYYENAGSASAFLYWTVPGGSQTIIPATNLLPL